MEILDKKRIHHSANKGFHGEHVNGGGVPPAAPAHPHGGHGGGGHGGGRRSYYPMGYPYPYYGGSVLVEPVQAVFADEQLAKEKAIKEAVAKEVAKVTEVTKATTANASTAKTGIMINGKNVLTVKNVLIAAAVLTAGYFMFFAKKPIVPIKL